MEKQDTNNQTQPKKKGRPRKIRTPEELAQIEAKKRTRLTLAEKQELKLAQQHRKQAAKGSEEPKNKERFYCTNKELHQELLNWRNSGNSIYKIKKMVDGKIVDTVIEATPEKHEKYVEGCRYFLVYPTSDDRYKQLSSKTKFFKKYAGNVTEEVTEQVKNMGWAFDLDDPIEDRKISEHLGKMFLDIGNRLLNHSSFRNYDKELKDDMLMFGIEKVVKGLNNYNFKFNNPFAWVTQAFWNAYLSVLNRHYKQINIRKDLMVKLAQELETYTGISPTSGLAKCIKTYLGNDVEVE